MSQVQLVSAGALTACTIKAVLLRKIKKQLRARAPSKKSHLLSASYVPLQYLPIAPLLSMLVPAAGPGLL